MKTYIVLNAIHRIKHKPKVPYNRVYKEDFKITAWNEASAIEKVKRLQDRHDAEYMTLHPNVEDFANAPNYLALLMDYDAMPMRSVVPE